MRDRVRARAGGVNPGSCGWQRAATRCLFLRALSADIAGCMPDQKVFYAGLERRASPSKQTQHSPSAICNS